MASIGHIAVGLCAGRRFDGRKRSMLLFVLLSLLPDADVLGHALGVPYGAVWGHRGATHSFAFAAVVAILIAFVVRYAPSIARWRAFTFVFLVVASHGLLDTLTDGGRGAALLWPYTNRRYFAPVRPIRVAPLGMHFFSRRGLDVALNETLLFLPFFAYALIPRRRSGMGRRSA